MKRAAKAQGPAAEYGRPKTWDWLWPPWTPLEWRPCEQSYSGAMIWPSRRSTASQRVNFLWHEPKEFSYAWPNGQIIGSHQNYANLSVPFLFHDAKVLLAETVTLVSPADLDLEELHSGPLVIPAPGRAVGLGSVGGRQPVEAAIWMEARSVPIGACKERGPP
jgi:hypothetical protein